MVRLLRLETVLVFLVAAFGVSFLSYIQLHTNDDRVGMYRDVLRQRRLVVAGLRGLQEDAYAKASKEIRLEKGATLAAFAKMRKSRLSSQADEDGEGKKEKRNNRRRQQHQPKKEETAIVAGAQEQQLTEDGEDMSELVCSERTLSDPTDAEQSRPWLKPLEALLGVETMTHSVGKRAEVDRLTSELRPLAAQLQKAVKEANSTLTHLTTKMAQIDRLWSRWFDPVTNRPIYRGTWASDAVMHPTHEEGLALHLKYNQPGGGGAATTPGGGPRKKKHYATAQEDEE
jgi:hypothetical protein